MKKTYSKILSIKPAGKSKVYDFTVKDTHRILANNFYTSNCHVNHPDIEEFIMKKDDLTKVTGANISIKITDEFMKAVEGDQDYFLSWPIKEKQPEISEQFSYNKLYKREDKSYIKKVRAKEIWGKIIKQAHKNAEPGILFWDTMINNSPADSYQDIGFKTLGTNPCGEVGLSPYDSCRLGSINLSNMIINSYKSNAKIDWKLLEKTARFAQRVMDDIVTLEEEKINKIINKIIKDPEPDEIKNTELKMWMKVLDILIKGRRTGIGVLGLGDMLAKLNIQYGSKKATKLINRIFEVIAVNSYKESVQLAKERGAFPVWDYSKEANNPFVCKIVSNYFNNDEYDEYVKYGRRNIANLSIAPTGSLAILARTTSGIEPVFKIRSLRRKKINPNDPNVKVDFVDENGDSWEEYNVFHAEFLNWFKTTKDASFLLLQTREELMLYLNNLTEENLNEIIKKSPWAGSESHDIDYIEKVKMQGIIQKWIDHSISVTHNLPENISLEEVNNIYFQAWKAGCKGCTIYREGSRSGVLLSKKEVKFEEHHAPKRPRILESDYYVAKVKGKEFAVIIGLWENTHKPYEVFAFENPPMNKNCKGKTIKVGKGQYKFVNGEFEIENLELATERIEEKMLTLSASMLLRHGAPINHVIKTIKKIDENITSFSSAVRRYLGRYIDEELEEKCPECNGQLVREEGCVHCNSCSYSRC